MNRYSQRYLVDLAKGMRKNSTETELILWNELKWRKLDNKRFRRQNIFWRYIADFYCAEVNLVIEVDWKIHENQKEYDEIREEILKTYKLKILRFNNEDIINNLTQVLETIKSYY